MGKIWEDALNEALENLEPLKTELLLPVAGAWNEMTFKDPSNPNPSVLPWFSGVMERSGMSGVNLQGDFCWT